jgi:LysM repeat protein
LKYTVKSGDSLSSIGEQFGVGFQTIASANGVYPPYIIQPGQSLEIPMAGSILPNGGATMNNNQPFDFSSPLQLVVNGAILYGIFRVLMKVL